MAPIRVRISRRGCGQLISADRTAIFSLPEARISASPDPRGRFGALRMRAQSGPRRLRPRRGRIGTAQRVMIVPDGTDQIVLAGMQTFSSAPVNGVYRSIDSGVKWVQILGTGLPSSLWGYNLTTSPTDPHTVYVTDGNFSGGGIYRSTDAGANWSPYLTRLNVRGIAIDPSSANDVYFWTSSRPRQCITRRRRVIGHSS